MDSTMRYAGMMVMGQWKGKKIRSRSDLGGKK